MYNRYLRRLIKNIINGAYDNRRLYIERELNIR